MNGEKNDYIILVQLASEIDQTDSLGQFDQTHVLPTMNFFEVWKDILSALLRCLCGVLKKVGHIEKATQFQTITEV